MKKPFAALFVLCLALPLLAQEAAPAAAKKTFTPEQLKARDERVLKKTGGLLDLKAEGPAVVVVETRAKEGAAPGQFVSVFERLSRINVAKKVVKAEGKAPLAIGRAEIAAGQTALAIVVAEAGADGPALSVYPEERIAVVNADKLAEGVTAPEAEIRVLKEIWRGLGFVGGTGYANFSNDVMQPVFSSKELDANAFQVMQPLTFPKLFQTLERFGVKRARRVPYRVAVRQGWAAAPTNRYQQAVWDEEKGKAKEEPAK